MIVRIELKFKDDAILTMLFGNSYKTWYQQFSEYCRNFRPVEILSIRSCSEKWIGTGLKWCREDEFQQELNREDCQQNEPDNSNPRKYLYFTFNSNKILENIAKKIIKNNE